MGKVGSPRLLTLLSGLLRVLSPAFKSPEAQGQRRALLLKKQLSKAKHERDSPPAGTPRRYLAEWQTKGDTPFSSCEHFNADSLVFLDPGHL